MPSSRLTLEELLKTDKPFTPRRIYRPFSGNIKVVSIPTSIEKFFHKDSVLNAYCLKENIIEEYKKLYLDKLKYILEEEGNIDIVVFGEYAFPYCNHKDKNKEFIEKLLKLSQEQNIYIVAGSYQDFLERNYGVTIILTPWENRPFKIIKWFKATQVNETISTPDEQQCKLIHSHFGYFTSLACLDIGDENFIKKFSEFVNNNESNKTVDVLINPSWDKSGRIIDKAKTSSYRTCMYYVHVNDSNCAEPTVFLAGEKIECSKVHSWKNDLIYVHELSMSDLIEKRKNWGKSTAGDDGI